MVTNLHFSFVRFQLLLFGWNFIYLCVVYSVATFIYFHNLKLILNIFHDGENFQLSFHLSPVYQEDPLLNGEEYRCQYDYSFVSTSRFHIKCWRHVGLIATSKLVINQFLLHEVDLTFKHACLFCLNLNLLFYFKMYHWCDTVLYQFINLFELCFYT